MAENASNKAVASNQMTTAVLTNLGKRLLDEAYQSGNKITIAEMSLGDSNHTYVEPNPDFTELVHEFGRQVINEGNTQETWINAIVYVDAKRWKGNSIFEFGLHDAAGNLIVYSSYPATTIPEDGSEHVQIEIECYLDLYNASAVSITITPIMQIASELEAGIARVATKAQVLEGVSDNTIVTPKKLRDTQQFQLYNPERLYKLGEICFTQSAETGEVSYWQWYSNVESLAGKDPLNTANRRSGWSETTKPWYWSPFNGSRPGETVWWGGAELPEDVILDNEQELPAVVYHRLAAARPDLVFKPDLVSSSIRMKPATGRYLRAANGSNYVPGQTHEDAIRNITANFATNNGWMFSGAGGAMDRWGGESQRANATTMEGAGNVAPAINFDASRVVPTANQNQPVTLIEWKGVAI